MCFVLHDSNSTLRYFNHHRKISPRSPSALIIVCNAFLPTVRAIPTVRVTVPAVRQLPRCVAFTYSPRTASFDGTRLPISRARGGVGSADRGTTAAALRSASPSGNMFKVLSSRPSSERIGEVRAVTGFEPKEAEQSVRGVGQQKRVLHTVLSNSMAPACALFAPPVAA